VKQTLQTIRAALDEQRPTLLPLRQLSTPSRGWIATVRSALGMSQKILSERLHVAKQRVSKLEAREVSGEATLAQMRDAADALDCDFVYALVPRKPLRETVAERARAIALRELGAVERSMQLEDQQTPIDEERIRDYIARHVTERDLWR
jgi:predicted DNA-binding mobile mystery protein A